jgi:hypothetical protein
VRHLKGSGAGTWRADMASWRVGAGGGRWGQGAEGAGVSLLPPTQGKAGGVAAGLRDGCSASGAAASVLLPGWSRRRLEGGVWLRQVWVWRTGQCCFRGHKTRGRGRGIHLCWGGVWAFEGLVATGPVAVG